METAPFTVVLGIAQDAGYPSAGCNQQCCAPAWENPNLRRNVASLAIVDPQANQRWMLDCTPDFKQQLHLLDTIAPTSTTPGLDGILLTHAHIGHYTGLMQLGREVLGAQRVPVHVMPRLRSFLENNAPWGQLASLGNIALNNMAEGSPVQLGTQVQLTPFLVPHRGKFSETVGFRIEGPSRSVIYIPDIDGWDNLEPGIEQLIASVDTAYLDGTFFSASELPGRNISEIPHPTISSSIERFASLPDPGRGKVRFLHLNHTNPALNATSDAATAIAKAGHQLAVEGERFGL